jgi:hypothetical protein
MPPHEICTFILKGRAVSEFAIWLLDSLPKGDRVFTQLEDLVATHESTVRLYLGPIFPEAVEGVRALLALFAAKYEVEVLQDDYAIYGRPHIA